jgi:hypothetical protein
VEAEQVYAVEAPQPVNQVVRVNRPIQGLGNISSDGGMILLREEGWKEVKMSVISEVKPKPIRPLKSAADSEARILLTRHSYQAGLWNADEMGQHQYLEGARRQAHLCPRLTSVNDGAPWIERITTHNYPHVIQIIDWSHAEEVIESCQSRFWRRRPSISTMGRKTNRPFMARTCLRSCLRFASVGLEPDVVFGRCASVPILL